ncbi:STAS domain-containing protein [Bacillus seohaeanensis]|uniref:STAS domain-containing protein n=1 Tax=Bacillus seohaeanensis TaxID=284580 RepID=A0ABW5RR04_9BACI
MLLSIEKNLQASSIIFYVQGILDFSTVNEFLKSFNELENTEHLILDLSQLEFIDSTGVGAIIELFYLSQENDWNINLQGINEVTYDIFDTIGLFKILEAVQGEVV